MLAKYVYGENLRENDEQQTIRELIMQNNDYQWSNIFLLYLYSYEGVIKLIIT